MDKIELQAIVRPAGSPAKLRKDGLIPAIIYGHNKKTEHLAVTYGPFEKVFRKAGESTLIDLVVDGKKHNVIIQDVQRHYLTGRFQHLDFYEVSMTEKMKATVPLEFVGVSKAVKENAGILVTALHEVEVECLPADLPAKIEVDISALVDFDSAIKIKDLNVDAKKVEILASPEEAVASVNPPRNVEEELAAPVVEDISKVEGAAEDKPESAEGEEKK